MLEVIFYIVKEKGFKIAICFVFVAHVVYPQQVKIDSLNLVLRNCKAKDKPELLIELCRVHATIDYLKALNYAKEAYNLAYQFGDSARIVKSARLIGQLFNRMSMNKEAQEILERTIAIAKRNNLTRDYKLILSNLGIAYTFQAKYDKALESNFQALTLREADKEYDEVTLVLNNIGLVYFKLNNFQKAITFYKRAIDLKKTINDHYDLDRLLINTGLCYIELKDFSKSTSHFKGAFLECGETCTDQIKIEGEFGIAISYYKRGHLSEAQRHLRKSLDLARKINNYRFQAENLVCLSRIYLIQKKYDSTRVVLSACEDISVNSGYNEILIEAYNEFANLYTRLNDFEKASHYQSRYIILKDSIHSEELTQNLMAVQAEHEQRENKAKLESQSELLALKEEIIERQYWLNLLAVATVLLLTALITALYRNNRQKKRTNLLLEQKVFERTQNLSESYQLIDKAYHAQANLIGRIISDIKSPLSTIKGLCSLALQDIHDHRTKKIIIQMRPITEQLSDMLDELSLKK